MGGATIFSSESLSSFLDAMPVPLAWFRMDNGHAVLLNRAFREVFGYELADVANWGHWSSRFIDPSQRELAVQQWHRQTRKRNSPEADGGLQVEEMEIEMLSRDGRQLTILHSGVVLPAMNCALAICIDITARKQNELRLAEAERNAREREVLYPLLLELTQEMIVLTNADGARSFVSPAVLPLTGWSQEEYMEHRMETMVHPDDLALVTASRERCLHGATGERVQYRTRKKDGTWLWVEASGSCYRDPRTQSTLGYVATLRDASEKQAEEARRAEREAILEQQARFDQLTGVANRHVFHSALSDEARRQTRCNQELGLLLIDVDNFKLFNDRYGHLEGDRVLRIVASVLKSTANRIADLVARFGGEEFVLLLPVTDVEGATAIAKRILHAVQAEAIPHADSACGVVTVSVGIACWPGNAPLDRDQLLLRADKALYAAKRAGRNTFALRHCSYTEAAQLQVPRLAEGIVPRP